MKMKLKHNKGVLDPVPFPSWGPQLAYRSMEGGWGGPHRAWWAFTGTGGGVCLGKRLSAGGGGHLVPSKEPTCQGGEPIPDLAATQTPQFSCGLGWSAQDSLTLWSERSWVDPSSPQEVDRQAPSRHPHPQCHNEAPQQEAG